MRLRRLFNRACARYAASTSKILEFGQNALLPFSSPRSQRSHTSSDAQLRHRCRRSFMTVSMPLAGAKTGSRPTARSMLCNRRSEFADRYFRYAKTSAIVTPTIAMAATSDTFITHLLARSRGPRSAGRDSRPFRTTAAVSVTGIDYRPVAGGSNYVDTDASVNGLPLARPGLLSKRRPWSRRRRGQHAG